MYNKKVRITYTDPSLKENINAIINSSNIEADIHQAIPKEEILIGIKSYRGPAIGGDINFFVDLSGYLIGYYERNLPNAMLDYAHLKLIEKTIKPLFKLAKDTWKNKKDNKNTFGLVGDFNGVEIHYSISIHETDESFKKALDQLPDVQKRISSFFSEIPINAFKIKIIFKNDTWLIDFKTIEFELITCNNKLTEEMISNSSFKKLFAYTIVVFIIIIYLIFK